MIAALVARFSMRLRGAFWRLVYNGARARYRLAPPFRFNGGNIDLYGDGEIEIGDDSYIGEISKGQACAAQRVTIGRRCRHHHNVRNYPETSDADCDFRNGEDRIIRGDVRIGDGVWIGVNSYIGPGVAI